MLCLLLLLSFSWSEVAAETKEDCLREKKMNCNRLCGDIDFAYCEKSCKLGANTDACFSACRKNLQECKGHCETDDYQDQCTFATTDDCVKQKQLDCVNDLCGYDDYACAKECEFYDDSATCWDGCYEKLMKCVDQCTAGDYLDKCGAVG